MTEPAESIDTLLIVDDEPNIIHSLERLFRRAGYRLLHAENGAAGLALLEENEVGVILSDQRMPDMNGVEFLSEVRERWPDTVRIVLSGYTELSSVTESVNKAGIYKFLTKPWDDEALRETVRKAFHLYRVTRENTRLNAALREANADLARWNQELEQRVEEKTREALRNLSMLRASQEILAHLPLPVLGIDPDGYLVLVNRAAEQMLGITSGYMGELVSDVLPAALTRVGMGSDTSGVCQLPDGRNLAYWRYPLGSASSAMGTALVIHQLDSASQA